MKISSLVYLAVLYQPTPKVCISCVSEMFVEKFRFETAKLKSALH